MFAWSFAILLLGGGLGSVLRHVVLHVASGPDGRRGWIALLAVNLLGAAAFGAVDATLGVADGPGRIIAAGLLGGFTSFSALSVMSDRLDRDGRRSIAVAQAVLSLLLAVPAVAAGEWVGARLMPPTQASASTADHGAAREPLVPQAARSPERNA